MLYVTKVNNKKEIKIKQMLKRIANPLNKHLLLYLLLEIAKNQILRNNK